MRRSAMTNDKHLSLLLLRQEPEGGQEAHRRARRSTSATSASGSATTSSRRRSRRRTSSYGPAPIPKPARDQDGPRRVRDRAGAREEDPRGRGPQPLQAHRRARSGRTTSSSASRTSCCSAPPAAARRCSPRRSRDPQRAVRHRRRHHPHRGRLRRRGRREHHRHAAPERRPRHRARAARHRLHRRDRQDRAQEREPVASPATCRARACSRRCSRSSRARSRNVPPKGGRKHPQQEFLQVDTTNILFICGGAFVGLEEIIEQPHRPEADRLRRRHQVQEASARMWELLQRGRAGGPARSSA